MNIQNIRISEKSLLWLLLILSIAISGHKFAAAGIDEGMLHVGRWLYTEVWPSIDSDRQNFMEYELMVKTRDSAVLTISGTQVYEKLAVSLQPDNGSINVVMERVIESYSLTEWKNGDILIKLKPEDNGSFVTIWKQLQPILKVNARPGVYLQYTTAPSLL